MKGIRIDVDGRPRCWSCGTKDITAGRALRSRRRLGLGGASPPKLKCPRCGQINDTGNGETYDGPAQRRYRAEYEQEMQARNLPVASEPRKISITQELENLAA